MLKHFKNPNFSIIILFVLIGTVIYANSLFNPFIYDDFLLVHQNLLIRSFDNFKNVFQANLFQVNPTYYSEEGAPSNFYRPIQHLTYMFDYHFYGLDSFGYHLVNIILHILNAVLVYFLLFIITKKKQIAFIAGLLFLVHPVHNEAVAYISGRADLLAGMFMLSSIIFFAIYPNQEKRKGNILYSASVICFVLALLSKELALMIPILLLLYDFSFRREIFSRFKNFIKRYAAFILIGLIYAVLRLTVLKFSAGQGLYLTAYYSWYARLIIFLHAFSIYLRILFLPIDLHMCRVFTLSLRMLDPTTLLSAASFFLSIILLVYSYRKSKLIFFSVAWYLILLLPQSGLFYPINAFMADHFLYLPSIGFFLLLGFLLTKYCSRKIVAIIMIILVGFYAPLTAILNYSWRKPEHFYKRIIKYSPYCIDAHYNLGVYYRNVGRYKEAEEKFKKIVKYHYNEHQIRFHLADIYVKTQRYDEAIQELNTVLKLMPSFKQSEIYNNLGYIYQMKKSYRQAIDNYKRAIKIKPDFALARWNLASIYLLKGQTKAVIGELENILGLGAILSSKEKEGPNKKEIMQIIRHKREYISIFNELGILFSRYNRIDVAENIFKRTIELSPNQTNAYFNLGILYYTMGQGSKAKILWQQALKVNPRHLPSQEWLNRLQIK